MLGDIYAELSGGGGGGNVIHLRFEIGFFIFNLRDGRRRLGSHLSVIDD